MVFSRIEGMCFSILLLITGLVLLSKSVLGQEWQTFGLIETDPIKSMNRPASAMQKDTDREQKHGIQMPTTQLRHPLGDQASLPDVDPPASRSAGERNDIKARKFRTIGAPLRKRNFVYAKADGKPLHLDLYIPGGSGPHPLIVWIHGGGWQKGDKNLRPTHPASQPMDKRLRDK